LSAQGGYLSKFLDSQALLEIIFQLNH
jgi:hypothetical protein